MSPPPPLSAALSTRGGYRLCGGGGGGGNDDDDAVERPAGDMATTSPRLFLWELREGGVSTGGDGLPPRRREVTFRGGGEARDDGGGAGGDKPTTTTTPVGADGDTPANAVAGAAAAVVALQEARGGGGGTERVGGGSGSVLRPDFIQLSYAMKKAPDGGCGGGGRSGVDAERGAQRGQVRVFRCRVLLRCHCRYAKVSLVPRCVLVLSGTRTRPRNKYRVLRPPARPGQERSQVSAAHSRTSGEDGVCLDRPNVPDGPRRLLPVHALQSAACFLKGEGM